MTDIRNSKYEIVSPQIEEMGDAHKYRNAYTTSMWLWIIGFWFIDVTVRAGFASSIASYKNLLKMDEMSHYPKYQTSTARDDRLTILYGPLGGHKYERVLCIMCLIGGKLG